VLAANSCRGTRAPRAAQVVSLTSGEVANDTTDITLLDRLGADARRGAGGVGPAAEPDGRHRGARPATDQTQTTVSTVVSVSRTTMVVRTADSLFRLFVLGPDTFKPSTIPPGASVSVESRPGPDPNAPTAVSVMILAPPPAGEKTEDVPIPPADPGRDTATTPLDVRRGHVLNAHLETTSSP
jgi:hypothetical protein